jgi:hypothetical protein
MCGIGRKSGLNESVSEAGIGWLHYTNTRKLGWIFREQATQDKGVDAHVEKVIDGEAPGRLLGLQIKSGSSCIRKGVVA